MKPNFDLDAALLDLDGTLISSINTYFDVAHKMCKRHGLPFDEEIYRKHSGRPLEKWLQETTHDADLIKQFLEDYRSEVRPRLAKETVWRPGAEEYIRELQQIDFPRAIATTNSRETFEVLNRRFGITQRIKDVITGTDTPKKSKPSPEPLHKARVAVMKRFGVRADPTHYHYMGDGEFDVLASLNAGVWPVLIPHEHTHEDAFHPEAIVIQTHAEALELLGI